MSHTKASFQHHDVNPNYFGAETLEWDQYHQFRPAYPKELFETIFTYHERNAIADNDHSSLAADFGSGPGTIIPNLLKKFKKVYGSDLNERQIKLGKIALQGKFGKERVEMHVGAAGECDWIEDGKADLFTSAEAVQWFDSDLWVEEASKKLKPGGTLAFWYYSPNCTIISHPEAAFYCNKLFSILFESVWSSEGFPRGPVQAHALKLKNIGIDSTKFIKEVRQFWNLPKNVEGVNGLGENPPSSFSLVEGCDERVAKDAKVIEQECKDANSCFLQRSSWTTKELLHYVESLGMPMDVLYKHEEYDSTINSLHQIVGGEKGTFTVGWWLSLVMATRA